MGTPFQNPHCKVGTIIFRKGRAPAPRVTRAFMTRAGMIYSTWKLTGVRHPDGALRYERFDHPTHYTEAD